MPGTLHIDQHASFTAALFMSCAQKMKFGSTEPDMAATGERKWSCEVAVTYHSDFGMKAQSEVLSVSIISGTDPSNGIPPGSAVEFADLRCGFMAPEVSDNGRGARVRGGRPFFSATGLRTAHGSNGRQPATAGAKSE